MPDDCLPAGRPDYATFLVEDVILTLANLRGSLDWLADDGTGVERRIAGLKRIERQIDLLEDRARTLYDQLREGSERPAATKIWAANGPVFRSRRRAHG